MMGSIRFEEKTNICSKVRLEKFENRAEYLFYHI